MNGSLAALAELAAIAEAAREAGGVDVAICPPFTLIAPAVTRSGGLPIGAQDCHAAESGAHTGASPRAMLKEAGGRLAIVGHSERRAEQRESGEMVRAKAEAALTAGLAAHRLRRRERGGARGGPPISSGRGAAPGSLPDDWDEGELVLAYEPIWAIGTGNVATPADVAEMHGAIRAALAARYGERGERIRILYGGSVKPDNAAELFAVPKSTAPWSAAPASPPPSSCRSSRPRPVEPARDRQVVPEPSPRESWGRSLDRDASFPE